jgi:hypothetical protein
MPVTDFANEAAATSAGFAVTKFALGPGWVTRFSKPRTGAGQSGGLHTADAHSLISQADADTKALASLNAQRRAVYGGSPGRASGDVNSPDSRGVATVTDVT